MENIEPRPESRNRSALLAEAQTFPAWIKSDGSHPRVRYGAEDDDWGAQQGKPCSDCDAKPGQLHALGCQVERCPLCGWSALDCDHNWYDAED